MNKKEKWINKIDKALNSKKNKLSKKTRSDLEEIQNGLRSSRTLSDVIKWILRLLKVIGAKSIFKNEHWPFN